MIKVFVEFCSQLSCFEDLLFVWEPAGWQCHDICMPSSKMGEGNFSKKKLWQVRKLLISKRRRRVNFVKEGGGGGVVGGGGGGGGGGGVQGIFGENTTLNICSIINN